MRCQHWERLGCIKVKDGHCTARTDEGVMRCNATRRCHIPDAAFEVKMNSQPQMGWRGREKRMRKPFRRAALKAGA